MVGVLKGSPKRGNDPRVVAKRETDSCTQKGIYPEGDGYVRWLAQCT